MSNPAQSNVLKVPAPSRISRNLSNINLMTWEKFSKPNQSEITADEFVTEVLDNVEIFVSGKCLQSSSCSISPLTPKAVKEKKLKEDHRLINWKRWIKIREKQSEKIRKFTLRRRTDLLLNTNPNDYRTLLNQKTILERSSKGSGATNFWKLPEKSRKDIHLTLPKSERVENGEIEFTQTPDLILQEQNIPRARSPTTALKMIQKKVAEKMCTIQPDLTHFAIKGNVFGDGLERQERETKKDSIRLSFHGKPPKPERKRVLSVCGLKVDNIFPEINILIDLTFEASKFESMTKILMLENFGEVAIDIVFKKANELRSIADFNGDQSFFFEKNCFRITPGEELRIPFHFYPRKFGIFAEKWILSCNPKFSDECKIVISLFGQCSRKFKNVQTTTQLANLIEKNEEEFQESQTSIVAASQGLISDEENISSEFIHDSFQDGENL